MLESVIVKALKKLCHSQAISRLFSKKATSTWYQFMGFVSSHTNEGHYLIGFHLSSFVIFQTDLKYSNTIVACTLTSCHHILSNMQDWLLQLLQIFEYLHQALTPYHQQCCWRWCNTSVLVLVGLFLNGIWQFNPYTGLQWHCFF